jgi:CRP/FNR family cyclic AMP-dependent transcriptional regulator
VRIASDAGDASMHDKMDRMSTGILLAETDKLIQKRPDFFSSLDEPDRNRVLAIGHRVVFEPDEMLWRQGDPHRGIYFIDEGRVRTFYLAPSGREVSLAYWFPGNFVGGPDMFGSEPHVWSSIAVHRTVATFLPGGALRALALDHAPIAVALLDALAFKARCYAALAQMVGTRSSTERLERLIAYLAATYGMKDEDGIMIGVSLTHAELASLIGSTRQWVTIQLARLQKQSALRYNRGIIVVQDLGWLGSLGSS